MAKKSEIFYTKEVDNVNNENNIIDITGINKDMLLHLLWANATDRYNIRRLEYFENRAKKHLNSDGYADYVCGRPIKCQIYNTDHVDSTNYNINNGINKLQDIVKYISFITTHTYESYKGPPIIDPNIMTEAVKMAAEFF